MGDVREQQGSEAKSTSIRPGRLLKPVFTLKQHKSGSFDLDTDAPGGGGQVQDGIAITSYGRGQVTGVTYTVPAHGEINVNAQIKMLCVTQADVKTLSDLIRGMLDASQYQHYDELSKTTISGGASFFGFFGWGGASASYEDTKHVMSGFGLSEANQVTIINAMAAVAQNVNTINMTGTVYNRTYDYAVSGNIWCIVMDATIQESNGSFQTRRFTAPNGLLIDPNSGASLPVITT